MRRTCWVNLSLLFYFPFPLCFSKLHCENSSLAQPAFLRGGTKGHSRMGQEKSVGKPPKPTQDKGGHSEVNTPRKSWVLEETFFTEGDHLLQYPPPAPAVRRDQHGAAPPQWWAALGPLSRPEWINGQVRNPLHNTGSLLLGTVASRLAGQKLWGVLLSPTRPHLTTDALDIQMYTGTPSFMWFWGFKLGFSQYAASSLPPESSIFKYWAIFIVNVSGHTLDTGIQSFLMKPNNTQWSLT